MPTYTHTAGIRYLAVCENHGCDWTETHLNADEAQAAASDHMNAHILRHTCTWNDPLGEWLGVDDCPACDYEKPRSLRRGRSAERERCGNCGHASPHTCGRGECCSGCGCDAPTDVVPDGAA